jgi:lipopolysaccharide cholinephosphotransferase
MLAQNKIQDKKLVLFGLNSSSYVVRDYLQDKGFFIAAYIDNDEKKRRKSKETIPAYSPEQLKQVYEDDVAIMITSKYYLEMKEQLELLGYEEEKQIFQIIDVKQLEQYIDFSDVEDMIEIDVEQLKKIQMKLLRILKQVCEKHHLRYYLTGGSLLGAVRHKGYIPWDDDIDVVMPMKDYKEFISIMNCDGKYQVLNAYDHPEIFHSYYARMVYPNTNMKTWDYPYIESLGVNIDIFPLWGFPKNEDDINRFADKMEELHVAFIEEYIKSPSPNKRYYELQKEILSMMDQYPFDESANSGYLLSRHKKKEIMPRMIYDNTIMSEFEGELFAIPVGYDEYLTTLFGENYMELPPETERCSAHNFRAFIKDNRVLE